MVTDEIRIGLKRRNILAFVFFVALLVLVIPTLVRFYHGNDSLIGSEPYYHYRAAAELLDEGSYNLFDPPKDVPDLVFHSRDYFFTPYHYLLVYFSHVISLLSASRVVPLILGIFSIILFNIILKHFIEEGYKRHLVLLLLVINPAFIYTFTVSNQHSMAIALTLLGIWFFLRSSRYNIFICLVCFAMVSFFSLLNTVVVLLVLLAYVLTKRRFQSRFVVVILVMAFISLARRASLFYNYAYSPGASVVSNVFSDLGGLIGFGIFSIVLAVYGVSSNWKRKSVFIFFFVFSLLLLLSIFFIGSVANMYLMFFVAVAAGIGFVKLYELKWHVPAVKNLTLLILLCGLLFSTASYLTRLSSADPGQEMLDSLQWLGSNTFKDDFVLSHYDNGYMISTVARNPVLADSLWTSDHDQRFLYKVQDSMFHSRKLKTAKRLFDAYDIKYVYVTPGMKEGLVWSRPDEGLLFLFTSPSTFRNVYDKDGYEIWEVINTTVS